MIKEKYKQPVPITDYLPLDGLGYGSDAYAIIVVNSTEASRVAWDDTFDAVAKKGESTKEFIERILAMRSKLVPFMVTEVHLTKSFGYSPLTPQVIEQLNNIDDRVIPLCIQEMKERRMTQMLDAARTFRRKRSPYIESTSAPEKAHTESDNSTSTNEDN